MRATHAPDPKHPRRRTLCGLTGPFKISFVISFAIVDCRNCRRAMRAPRKRVPEVRP